MSLLHAPKYQRQSVCKSSCLYTLSFPDTQHFDQFMNFGSYCIRAIASNKIWSVFTVRQRRLLRVCAYSPEILLLDNTKTCKISCAGIFDFDFCTYRFTEYILKISGHDNVFLYSVLKQEQIMLSDCIGVYCWCSWKELILI